VANDEKIQNSANISREGMPKSQHQILSVLLQRKNNNGRPHLLLLQMMSTKLMTLLRVQFNDDARCYVAPSRIKRPSCFRSLCVLFILVQLMPLLTARKFPLAEQINQRSLETESIMNAYCPTGRVKKSVFKIAPMEKFAEVSYMAYSNQTYKGKTVVWMGSDGFQNSISAVDIENGVVVNSYKLDITFQDKGDWESLSVGPCYSYGTNQCIYIGNMGNNRADLCTDTDCQTGRAEVYIYKLKEPNINEIYDSSSLPVATLIIRYAKSNFPTNRANSESLFIDHTGDKMGGKPGDLYFITKFRSREDLQRVGKISVDLHGHLTPGSSTNVSITAVGKISQTATWTDGTMNREGNLIAIRSWNRIWFYPRNSSQTIAAALESEVCPFVSQSTIDWDQTQFESVTFMPFPYYAEASECILGEQCTLDISLYKLLFN